VTERFHQKAPRLPVEQTGGESGLIGARSGRWKTIDKSGHFQAELACVLP